MRDPASQPEPPSASAPWARGAALLVAAALLAGCSIRSLAIDALAGSLAESGDVFASDEDPELVREAIPFALKTMESLLAEKPEHRGLLLSACAGFTQYGYAFVESDAFLLEEEDYAAAERGYQRALKLYLRARGYCLRALELTSPDIRRALEMDAAEALDAFGPTEVPLLFWTGAAWGSAIGLAVDRPEIAVDIPAVRALVARCLELDADWDGGSVHEVAMVLEALPATMGGSRERARDHFERAVELSRGRRAGPYVAYAEKVALADQRRDEFARLLDAALAIDVDAAPSQRVANLVAQRRARHLRERVDDLFLPADPEEAS